MTSKEALREIARQERRFEKFGFKNGIMLAKSARDYYAEMIEWQGKVAAAAKSHAVAKAKLENLWPRTRVRTRRTLNSSAYAGSSKAANG